MRTPCVRCANEGNVSNSIENSPREEVVAATVDPSEPAAETSLLRVLWYPLLLFIGGPAIVMYAVKLVFGI
jgi:hypothetical protein